MADPVGRYSRVSRRIWNDAGFRGLSKPPPCGQALFLRLIAAPEMGTIPGLFQAWESGLAEAMGWPMKGFREAFAEVSSNGMAKADWTVGLVYLPNGIKHNEPANPNVVRGWRNSWSELPDCKLKAFAHSRLAEFLETKGEPFAEAFANACPKPLVNHSDTPAQLHAPNPLAKQDQEQDQEQKQEQKVRNPSSKAKSSLTLPPGDFAPSEATLAVAAKTGRSWHQDWDACRDWALAKGERKADWQATLRGWMRRSAEQQHGKPNGFKRGPPQQNAPADDPNAWKPREWTP